MSLKKLRYEGMGRLRKPQTKEYYLKSTKEGEL